MQRLKQHIAKVARGMAPVLIHGESGTGKELVARALHAQSPRADKPFIAVNLGAIPQALATAELFGAERGAYTGAAARHLGLFQRAQGGTLFLDEIGEAPPEVQVLLLRAIETGEVRALGAGAAQTINVRLISATDADLEARIGERAFRAPLLHRLATCEIHLPPLRQRREDLGPLVLHFLRSECAAQGRPYLLDRPDVETAPWLPLPLMVQLAAHDYPGNVRQLRNLVRQMVLASDEQLSLALPAVALERVAAPPLPPSPAPPVEPWRKPTSVSEEELLEALAQSRWDLKATAARLGVARPSLYTLLARSPHIRTARDLTREEIARSQTECGGDLESMAQQLRVSGPALVRRLRELKLR